MTKQTHIRVNTEDDEELMGTCKDLLLREKPELKGIKLSRAFMFNRVIEFYKKF